MLVTVVKRFPDAWKPFHDVQFLYTPCVAFSHRLWVSAGRNLRGSLSADSNDAIVYAAGTLTIAADGTLARPPLTLPDLSFLAGDADLIARQIHLHRDENAVLGWKNDFRRTSPC